jgi:hypothetical protein
MQRLFLCLLALVLLGFVCGLKVPLMLALQQHSKKLTASLSAALIVATMGTTGALAAIDDPAAMARFEGSLNELTLLDEKWDTIVKGGGDNVRRKLGTVYAPPKCENPMCAIDTYIPKFVKSHPEELDMETFEEPASQFLEAYNQVQLSQSLPLPCPMQHLSPPLSLIRPPLSLPPSPTRPTSWPTAASSRSTGTAAWAWTT